jgi:hypothetical protein
MHMSGTDTRGSVTTNRTHIAWDLSLLGQGRPFVPYPERLYNTRFPAAKMVSPEPDVRVSGTITVNGELWQVDQWHGMQGHHWGTRRPEVYAWAHCNLWSEPEDLVLEASTTRHRSKRFLGPQFSTICMRYQGRDYAFNGPLQVLSTRANIGVRRYGFSAKGPQGKLDAIVDAHVDDLVGLHYRNPNGTLTHCLNAALAHARVRFEPHDGHPVAVSSRAASLELGTPRQDHGVMMML